MGNAVNPEARIFSEIQTLSLDTTLKGYSAFFHHVCGLSHLTDVRIGFVDPLQPLELPHSLLHDLQSKYIVSLGILYPQSQEDIDRIEEALQPNTSILRLVMAGDFTPETEAIEQILDRNRDLYFTQRDASLCALFIPRSKYAFTRRLFDPRLICCIRSYIPPELPVSRHSVAYVSQISEDIKIW